MSNKAELVEQAEELGIDIPEGATKAEIQELIYAEAPKDNPTAESGEFEPKVNEDEIITHDFLGTPIADIDYPPSKPEYAQAYQHPVV